VGFFVNLLTRFFAGALKEAKDGPFVVIYPIIQVIHAVFFLGLDVFFVSFDNILDACINISMNVHIQCHSTL